MATVDTRLGASAHFANVLGLLGNYGRTSISGLTPPAIELPVAFDPANAAAGLVLSNGNRTVRAQAIPPGAVNPVNVLLDTGIVSGKRYIEFRLDLIHNGFMPAVGTLSSAASVSFVSDGSEIGSPGNSLRADGTRYGGGVLTALLPAFAAGDVLMLAVDVTAKRLWFGRNGTWSGNPAANTSPAYTTLEPTNVAVTQAAPLRLASSLYLSQEEPSQITVQGTAATFTYTPPAGFVGVGVQ